MFEYDNETIKRILKIEGFQLDNLNLNEIKHVPMHQYRISNALKPLLLVENLQVCVGLYAIGKNFAFAAHLNPVAIRGDEFKCDINKNIIYCNRIDDLFNAITNSNLKDNIFIGIQMGFNPVKETYQLINMLDNSINNLISKLNTMGIKANKLDLQNNHIFIIDTKNGKLITPLNEKIKIK